MTDRVDSSQIKQWAGDVGFDLVGVAPAEPIEHADYFRQWIARGCHGSMDYLARHREKRIDPRRLFPWARSIICIALSYNTPPAACPPERPVGRIARYAQRRDYHQVIKTRLSSLAERIRQAADQEARLRVCVDTVPLAEKHHAARAGLGWIGKNGLLINQHFGSWLLLGEIIIDLPLTYDTPVESRCGDCNLCMRSCPTGALVGPHQLDARRCVSYLTVESGQRLPSDLAGLMDAWAFGCDMCQESCPFNRTAAQTADPEIKPRPEWSHVDLQDAQGWDENHFTHRYAHSPVVRAGWTHFQRCLNNCRVNLPG